MLCIALNFLTSIFASIKLAFLDNLLQEKKFFEAFVLFQMILLLLLICLWIFSSVALNSFCAAEFFSSVLDEALCQKSGQVGIVIGGHWG